MLRSAARAVALAAVLLTTACAGTARPVATDGAATVAAVIDGDTIVVSIGGTDVHVRLIGVDTPETKKPNTPVECYGKEASARTSELLPKGTAVRLERDVEARDRYARLLAYVYRASDGLFVEADLIAGGYAGPLVIEPNVAHSGELAALSAEAKRAGRGLWAACGGNHVVR